MRTFRGGWKGAAVLPAMLIAACQANPADPKWLDEASAKYTGRQVEESEALADKYINANPPGERLDEAFYLRGLSRFTRGNRTLAATDLKQAIAKTNRLDLKSKAHRALGDIEFEGQEWAAAQGDYEAALAQATLDAAGVTMVNYRIGVCQQALGQWGKAQAWFLKVVSANNNEALKERAVARITATHFALQFGAFREAANARDLVADLQKAGVTANIDSELREGQFWYLVRSGSYTTWADAGVTREKLLPKYPLVSIIP